MSKSRDGLQSYCKSCSSASTRESRERPGYVRPQRKPYHETRNRWNLKRYGLTVEEYERMLAAQGGGCAICGSADPGQRQSRFCIDHDHECCPTDRACCGSCVRGLLCMRCNQGIGKFDDDPALLQSAIDYLAA